MKINLSLPAPRWLVKFFAPDLLRRAELFGRAGRDWRHGKIVSGSVELETNGRSAPKI